MPARRRVIFPAGMRSSAIRFPRFAGSRGPPLLIIHRGVSDVHRPPQWRGPGNLRVPRRLGSARVGRPARQPAGRPALHSGWRLALDGRADWRAARPPDCFSFLLLADVGAPSFPRCLRKGWVRWVAACRRNEILRPRSERGRGRPHYSRSGDRRYVWLRRRDSRFPAGDDRREKQGQKQEQKQIP